MSEPSLSPDRILRELSELWAVAGGPHTESGAGVLRACTMTLIVVADADDDAEALGDTIGQIMREYPARAIFVSVRKGAGALEQRVYSQCWMPFGGKKQICCERVDIVASDDTLDDLCPVLSALEAPDLPSVLWWRSARLFDTPEFACVAAVAGKVIIDSAALPDAKLTLPRLAKMALGERLLGDLSWTQLTRWREMLARVFENKTRSARLPEVKELRVCFPGREAPVYAWYMAAWVLDALLRCGAKPALRMAPDAEMLGRALRVKLKGETFQVALERQDSLISVEAFGLSHRMNLPQPTGEMLMTEELGVLRRDPVFSRALSAAAELAASSLE